MEGQEKKNLVLSIIGAIITLLAIFGISYAVFTFTQPGTNTNYISTGTISMQYLESDTNIISITDATPITDSVGKNQSQFFDFKLLSNIKGNANISYEIRAKKLDVSPKKAIDPSKVKLYLEKEVGGRYIEVLGPKAFELNPNTVIQNTDVDTDTMLLYTGSVINSLDSKEQIDKFRLRMWVKDGVEPFTEPESFKIKVNVYASVNK